MKACGGCGDWIPDDAGFCPACGREQGAAGPPPAAPPAGETAGPGTPPGMPPLPGPSPGRVAARVRNLGLLYVLFGAGTLALTAWNFIGSATGRTLRELDEVRREFPEFGDVLDRVQEFYADPALLGVLHAVPFLIGVLMIWSGTRLRALQGRGLGITAAIAAILLAPCESCCCCMGIPLGIYALVVLTNSAVEALMAEGGGPGMQAGR